MTAAAAAPPPCAGFPVNCMTADVLFVLLQNATLRHIYLNSFSTEPQSARYGINRFSDLSQMQFRGKMKCYVLCWLAELN